MVDQSREPGTGTQIKMEFRKGLDLAEVSRSEQV